MEAFRQPGVPFCFSFLGFAGKGTPVPLACQQRIHTPSMQKMNRTPVPPLALSPPIRYTNETVPLG